MRCELGAATRDVRPAVGEPSASRPMTSAGGPVPRYACYFFFGFFGPPSRHVTRPTSTASYICRIATSYACRFRSVSGIFTKSWQSAKLSAWSTAVPRRCWPDGLKGILTARLSRHFDLAGMRPQNVGQPPRDFDENATPLR